MKKKLSIILAVIVLVMLVTVSVAFAYDGEESNGVGFDFLGYVVEEAYILIPALYFIGWCAKKIPNIPDWVIPFGLMVIAVPFAMALAGWDVRGALQGVIVTAITVYANQLYKQGKEAITG